MQRFFLPMLPHLISSHLQWEEQILHVQIKHLQLVYDLVCRLRTHSLQEDLVNLCTDLVHINFLDGLSKEIVVSLSFFFFFWLHSSLQCAGS